MSTVILGLIGKAPARANVECQRTCPGPFEHKDTRLDNKDKDLAKTACISLRS